MSMVRTNVQMCLYHYQLHGKSLDSFLLFLNGTAPEQQLGHFAQFTCI